MKILPNREILMAAAKAVLAVALFAAGIVALAFTLFGVLGGS